ncbi:GATA transcription factor 19-like [Euphorbia lathyris]|uniref:GATA transcription factor 19-like n=1 Tax=Euphorbia lathyris TaxID=212925 RepID=UPI0033136386
MMHRCSSSSSSQGNMMGQCTCGLFHPQTNSSFTMLFSHKSYDDTDHHMYSSSSASVDCTLSLGTPSTRLCEDDDKRLRHENHRPTSSFCWDILQNKNTPYNSSQTHNKTNRGANNNANADPLLARRCANCDTTSTPLWRNGPRGPKSLCNACGIRFKKEERRASAASSSSGMMEQQQYGYQNNNSNNSWVQTAQKMQMQPCYSPANANEMRFMEESDDRDYSDSSSTSSGIPFLSWRLNVTDRPSLVHDFTR